MAIDGTDKDLKVKNRRRTCRVEIFADDLTGNYEIRVWRESLLLNSTTGEILSRKPDETPISKRLSEFPENDPVMALAGQIAQIADSWDEVNPDQL